MAGFSAPSRLWALLCLWVIIPFTHVLGTQAVQKPIPDDASHAPSEPNRLPLKLNFTSSAPHLFASTANLLQQWPNTVFPNGHTLAAVTIPAYTLFFHGRLDADPPPSPEWLAFDQEMSYGIMGSTRNSFLLTYQTTRPVKALYFDGESAALMGLGQLDSQMLVLFGNVSGPPAPDRGFFRGLWPEYERALGLCDWFAEKGLGGPGWGFEGVARMNAGFEMIWCNFTSPSLRLLTQLNITAPQLSEGKRGDDEERWGDRLDEEEEAIPSEDDSDNGGIPHATEPDDTKFSGNELKNRGDPATSHYSLPPKPTRTDRAVDPSHPPAPPNWRHDMDREPFVASQTWGWFDSATWHYGSSRNGPGLGETRAKVLSCGILSFYAPRFANQSLNRALEERKTLNLTADGLWTGEGPKGNWTIALRELSRRRRYHHLGDVNAEEAALMRANVESALRTLLEPESNDCSGADWVLIETEIVQRTTLQLKMLESKFAALPPDLGNRTALRNWLADLRSHSHLFMVTYLEYPSILTPSTWDLDQALFIETFSRCRYRYTRLLAPGEGVNLSPEEADLRWAVEEVQSAICSGMLMAGFGIEKLWHKQFGKGSSTQTNTEANNEQVLAHEAESVRKQVTAWNDALQELAAWLGWENEFIGCKEVCAWDERCYIPMWPLISFRGRFERGPPRNGSRPGPPDGPGNPGDSKPGYGPRSPYYGWPHFPPNTTNPGGPGFNRPPRGRMWMGDETDLWEPKCVKSDYLAQGR